MTKDHYLSRLEVRSLAGVENDVMTYWIREGHLVPSGPSRGKGDPFKFHRDQVNIAALLRVARAAGLKSSATAPIAAKLQQAVQTYRLAGDGIASSTRVWEEADHPGQAIEMLEGGFIKQPEYNDIVLRAAKLRETAYDAGLWWMGLCLIDGENLLIAYKDIETGEWTIGPPANDDRLPAEFAISFDLARIASSINWDNLV